MSSDQYSEQREEECYVERKLKGACCGVCALLNMMV
jgi:hypothetical protein